MSDSKQHSPDRLPAVHDDAASSSLFHQQQPLPVERSVFWYPVNGASQQPRSRAYLRFITMGALRDMADHVNARPHEGRLGFLIGELFSCPDTNARYVVIDGIVPTPHPVREDRTLKPVDLSWPRLQEQLKSKGKHLLGWYHTHPRGGLKISGSDLNTHLSYFTQPWQLAIVLEPGIDVPRGVICEPGKEWPQNAALLPFYELLEPHSLLSEGVRRAYFRWHDYRTDTAQNQRAVKPPKARVATPATDVDSDSSQSKVILPRELDSAFDDALHGHRRPKRRWRWTRIVSSFVILLLAGAALMWKFVPWDLQSLFPRAETTQPVAVEPLVDPTLIRLDQFAGQVEAGVAGYKERARLFDNRQMTCADLTRGLTQVEERWMTYSVDRRSKTGDLDPDRAELDQSIYAGVQEVERHFRASQCPPP